VNLARKDGMTPLMAAAANGHAHVVDQLIRFESDKLAARKDDGATALHLASKQVRLQQRLFLNNVTR
jgi:ankyrin repeat protein